MTKITKEFKYNPNAEHDTRPNNKVKKSLNLIKQTIFVNQKDSFEVIFPDLFKNYQNPPIHTNEPWNTWIHSSFDWWQCQLNFAVWCATAGCGVSFEDHIQNTTNLTRSVYMFHLYYCTARILKELKSPLPTNSAFCYYKNPYSKAAYEQLCTEFHVPPGTDWRQKMEKAWQGLGYFTQYYKPGGEYRYHHKSEGPFFNVMDKLYHSQDISMAWTTFIPNKSKGFTKAGIERINESIRTYVWALLGAQSQTKVEILKVGTGFDAQKQFLANVQDVINSPIDLPTQISNYQNVLKYARSKVDYAYGLGLYMSPSDMVLQIGTIVGYNNKIVIATENQMLGLNDDLNNKNFDPVDYKPKPKEEPKIPEPIKIKQVQVHDDHEDHKKAIIFGSIVLGITALYLFS